MKESAQEYKKRNGVKRFTPIEPSPLPWRFVERDLWHTVLASNGKTVCSCRNLLGAQLIVKLANS